MAWLWLEKYAIVLENGRGTPALDRAVAAARARKLLRSLWSAAGRARARRLAGARQSAASIGP